MNSRALQSKGIQPSPVRKGGGQISHGLNLVLNLRNAAEMPLVLGKISQAQRKINAGLSELNFVHFARFLPTYDNKALQVITEFDGPLAPYALDFAIEIGDVFDMLLSYTEGTEHIVPIAEHPAEFLAFVEKNNTVTVPPGPGVPDWPLYAAYPGLSTLDIIGPRSELPIPKADRWATAVAREDVQGNILQGYRAERVRHFVLRVDDGPKARVWLAARATSDAIASGGVPSVTSYQLWMGGAKPALMLNIGFTHAGMEALGIRAPWLAPFPVAFKQGAMRRAEDNFDVDSNAPDHWWLGNPAQEGEIHVMVSLYQKLGAEAEFAQAVKALTDSLPDGGLQSIAEHDAAFNGGKGWFGYADGIANPRIATPELAPNEPTDCQPASTAGEFVLGADYKNIYGGSSLGALPAALANNGSFCAVRVLKLDVDLFHQTLEAEAARLRVDPDWLAAKLMGRWYDGAPLSLHPGTKPTNAADDKSNAFDYAPSYEYPKTPMDHVGECCPVGAHIRRSNPRTARVAGARYTRRLMRRGMHYELKNGQGQRTEVGLFGLFICADLERQFEFIQRQWINGDRFAAGLRGTRDPIAGTPRSESDEFEIPVSNGQALKVRLPQFVHTRGSLYLFMPGLAALRDLETFATNDAPALTTAVAAPRSPPELAASTLQQEPVDLKIVAAQLSEDDLIKIALISVGELPVDPKLERAKARFAPRDKLEFDPRQRAFQIDPYPTYAKFRAKEPVHYSPLYDGWFVFGYDDVVTVCKDDTNFSAAPLNGTGPRGLFTLDEPEHAELRSLVTAAWRDAAVNTDQSVQRSIDAALAALSGRPDFDLVDDFARGVPRDVYFDILGGSGIKPDERLVLDRLARTVMKHHNHLLDAAQRKPGEDAGRELAIRLGSMLTEARSPNSRYEGSFLAYLAKAVAEVSRPPSDATLVTTLVNLTVAGYMSVEFLLATGIRRLLLDRDKGWNRVRKDPSTLPLFLEEMRRTEHALSVVDRFAKNAIEMSGVQIPRGARVFGVLASANRDERVYGSNADKFEPHREFTKPHLGLGYGTHNCMGRLLEKSITEPTIRRLVEAMPDLRLQPADQPPPWFENFYFRSFDHLHVLVK